MMGVSIDISALTPFQEICRKICLNIPPDYTWQWDTQRNLAFVTMDKQDAELVFFPLFKEFSNHWNFNTSSTAEEPIAHLLNAQYGLMPGQAFFSSRPISELVLFVAWWPWGREDKVSMRVGLAPIQQEELEAGKAFQCLSSWLPLKKEPEYS